MLVTLAFLVCSLLAAHSALAGGHMGHGGSPGGSTTMSMGIATGDESSGGKALAMCLAVIETAAGAFIAAALFAPRSYVRARHLANRSVRRLAWSPPRTAPHGRARDGPNLQVFVI